MGQAIAVGRDFTSEEVRQLAKRAKDSSQARRLLAIAAVLDGASRQDAAKAAGMDRQTLRDWVIRFNEKGANGSSASARASSRCRISWPRFSASSLMRLDGTHLE